jgi:hypothetical protein
MTLITIGCRDAADAFGVSYIQGEEPQAIRMCLGAAIHSDCQHSKRYTDSKTSTGARMSSELEYRAETIIDQCYPTL